MPHLVVYHLEGEEDEEQQPLRATRPGSVSCTPSPGSASTSLRSSFTSMSSLHQRCPSSSDSTVALSPDAVPDIIDTSSGSKDSFFFGEAVATPRALAFGPEDDEDSDEHPYRHVPPPPVPSPCVKSARSKRRPRRATGAAAAPPPPSSSRRSPASSSRRRHHHHPPGGGSWRRTGAPHQHQHPRKQAPRSADDSRLCPAATMLRMLCLVGALSVSLTLLANRSIASQQQEGQRRDYYFSYDPRDYDRQQAATYHVPSSSTSSSLTNRHLHAGNAPPAAGSSGAAGLRGKLLHNLPSLELLSLSSATVGDAASTSSRIPPAGPAVSAGDAAAEGRKLSSHRSAAAAPSGAGSGSTSSSPASSSSSLPPPPVQRPSAVALPPGTLAASGSQYHFEAQDRNLYTTKASSSSTSPFASYRRVVVLHESVRRDPAPTSHHRRRIAAYPPDFTDPTQLYGVLDSSDERIAHAMERRPPLVEGECVPMQEWQTTFHPTCNALHEVDLSRLGGAKERPSAERGTDATLFGTKGYWRNAWRVDAPSEAKAPHDTVVLKTLKIEHRFEEKHFEHNRIDAVAMERLTSSPHVINVFGFCGNSVVTEYADGKRLGELADKNKKVPLARLRIAADIADGLADVHGIDGDGNATFVHLDVNPANVVSIGGTLKLNDFNIGIIRRWNTTSNKPCGFPAQYPNPQWRSPEEARGENDLTEKVDVFSMGHIFFRLICGHEPWNKLEPGGKPSKIYVNSRVEKGVLPTIPKEILQSKDPEIVAVRQAMLQCYTFDPAKRPSARDIATFLRKSLAALEVLSRSNAAGGAASW